MTEPSTITDPRIEAGAKAWDKYMGGRYAPNKVEELSEEVAVILAAADAVDPRKPRTITTVEELDALPEGSVVMLSGGCALSRSIFETRRASLFRDPIPLGEPPRWGLVSMQDDAGIPARDLLLLLGEITVLHKPEAEATR